MANSRVRRRRIARRHIRIADRPVSFPTSQNPIVTIGFICAPLILPIGESAIVAPTEPKKNPLMIRRSVRLGPSATNGRLSANIKIRDDKPISSNKPVPHISAMNNCLRVGWSSFMFVATRIPFTQVGGMMIRREERNYALGRKFRNSQQAEGRCPCSWVRADDYWTTFTSREDYCPAMFLILFAQSFPPSVRHTSPIGELRAV